MGGLTSHLKESLKGREPSPYYLQEGSEGQAAQVLMTGWLTKRGDLVKSWKKRCFVVKSDGTCDYHKLNDPKPKGSLSLAGYSVNDNPAGDAFNGKHFPFVLEPVDDSQRTWFLFANGEEEKVEWVHVFTQASRVASAYVNPDPVIRSAFRRTCLQARRTYGLASKPPRGPEPISLTDLVVDRLVSSQAGEALRGMAEQGKKQGLKYLRSMVLGKAGEVWRVSYPCDFIVKKSRVIPPLCP